MLPLLLDAAASGQCSYEDVNRCVTTGPAGVYRLERRGAIMESYHADLVLIDPELRRTVADRDEQTKVGWSPWRGRTLVGWPIMTFVAGNLAFRLSDDGPCVLADPGSGQEVDFGGVADD